MGLSIGVSGVLALLFSIYAYYTADDCIPNRQDIVYLKTILKDGSSYREVPYPLMDQLIETSADVVSGTHLHSWGNIWLELAGKDFQHRTDYADPEFFKVFDLPLKFGNSDTALKEKYSIVLTHKVSQQMFGETNPVGKTLKGADTLNLKITGVLEPISPYSSFRLGVLLPNTILEDNPAFRAQNNWENSFSPIDLKLRSGTDRVKLQAEVEQILRNHVVNADNIAEVRVMPYTQLRTDIIPVVDIIVKSSIAAICFILLIILVNLLNLNASTMLGRTKTLAVRKVLGSSKKDLILQYCIENGILVLGSILLAMVFFITFSLPRLNDTFGPEFGRISFSFTKDYPVVLGMIAIGVFATLIVSILPSLRFVKIPVYLGIKGRIEHFKSNYLFRNSFIILQFTIAILALCISVILNHQIKFMKNADLGFERNNILVGSIDLDYKNLDAAKPKFNALINDLESNDNVKYVSMSESIPSDYYFNYTTYTDVVQDRDVRMRRSYADDSYFKTLDVPIVQGRHFDKNIDRSDEYPAIINEAALKAFGWESIEGKRLNFKGSEGLGQPIVGVVKDFHYQDLQSAVEPLVHIYRDRRELDRHRFLMVSVKEGYEASVEQTMTEAFNGILSRKNYVQARLADKVSGQYLLIEGMLKTVNITALLAIFISCLGLFGLISFTAKRKVKEIGIRKVLGASVSGIVVLLSKTYMILVGVAALIAFPFAWYAMRSWLDQFAYSIDIKWWMFALAGIIALLITAFTLGLQAVRSATANPVNSLKSE